MTKAEKIIIRDHVLTSEERQVLKSMEYPFYHDDITLEEFEDERRYFLKCCAEGKQSEYVPLYMQKHDAEIIV